MSEQTSSISILTNIFTSPGKAFTDIQQNYPIALPLLTLIVLNGLLAIVLFANIDYQWFIDNMVEAQAGDLSKSEKDSMRQGMEMMSPGILGAIGALSAAVLLVIMMSINALYFVIVSNMSNDGFQFKQWLSLVVWSSLPTLLGTLASYIMIFITPNGQISPESLNPLSFNELFFGLNAMEGVGNILATVDITLFWTLALMTIGYSKWTGKSTSQSLAIVVIPYILYFGLRFLLV